MSTSTRSAIPNALFVALVTLAFSATQGCWQFEELGKSSNTVLYDMISKSCLDNFNKTKKVDGRCCYRYAGEADFKLGVAGDVPGEAAP
jgi:hypothetical protein